MSPSREGARFAVRFDALLFREDVGHATQAGRTVAHEARRRLECEGVAPHELRQCDPEHRDGTRLPNCVKIYLPQPGDLWRMVFEFQRASSGPIYLAYLAFGVGHPSQPWQRSVYEVAHHRLHAAG